MKRTYTLTDSQQPDREWEIHAYRCTHIRRGRRQTVKSFNVIKIESILNYWIDAELVEMGYSTKDIKVMSCTKNAPAAS